MGLFFGGPKFREWEKLSQKNMCPKHFWEGKFMLQNNRNQSTKSGAVSTMAVSNGSIGAPSRLRPIETILITGQRQKKTSRVNFDRLLGSSPST
jgi:hypothetical protein